jgi:hypothetical protein
MHMIKSNYIQIYIYVNTHTHRPHKHDQKQASGAQHIVTAMLYSIMHAQTQACMQIDTSICKETRVYVNTRSNTNTQCRKLVLTCFQDPGDLFFLGIVPMLSYAYRICTGKYMHTHK